MSNVYDQTPAAKQLVLGSLPLATPGTMSSRGYELEVLSTDADFGNPEPIEQEVRSLLLDGERVERLRDGNRASYFQIKVTSDNWLSLAQAEADIRAEVGKLNQLDWTPPHAGAPTAVYIVVTSSLAWLTEDHAERQFKRYYGLRLVCLPHVRSDFEVQVPALPTPGGSSPTITSINTCAATTGWSGSSTPTTDGASITINAANATNPQIWGTTTRWAQLTQVAFNPTPYLRVTARCRSKISSLRVTADGVDLGKAIYVDGNDWYFTCSDTSVTVLRITATMDPYLYATVTPTALIIDDVSAYSRLPSLGTGRQLARTIDVLGSERTPGSIALIGAANLGLAVVYTHNDPSGYTPPLSVGFLSGSSSTNAANISGKAFTGGANVFEKPLAQLPNGRYELSAFIQSSSTVSGATFAWTAQVYVGGVAVGASKSGTSPAVNFTAGTRVFTRLGRIQLPVTAVPPGSTATLRVTITANTPFSIDEAWLFNLSIGALTVVQTSGKCLWIDSATTADYAPAIMTGATADRSDAYALSYATDVLAVGTHIWQAGRTNVFTVTQNGTDVPVSFRYVPCWFANPALAAAP